MTTYWFCGSWKCFNSIYRLIAPPWLQLHSSMFAGSATARTGSENRRTDIPVAMIRFLHPTLTLRHMASRCSREVNHSNLAVGPVHQCPIVSIKFKCGNSIGSAKNSKSLNPVPGSFFYRAESASPPLCSSRLI